MKSQTMKKSDNYTVPQTIPTDTTTLSVRLSHLNFLGLRIHLRHSNGHTITLPIHKKVTTGIRAIGFCTLDFEAFKINDDLTISFNIS